MNTFRVLLLPLAVLLIGIAVLVGGRPATICALCGSILAGVAVVLVLIGS